MTPIKKKTAKASKYTQIYARIAYHATGYVYAYANLNTFMAGRKMLWPIRKIFCYIINIRRYTQRNAYWATGFKRINFLYDSHIK